jgi:hypothetical protein
MVIGNMRYIEIDSIIEQIKAEHCERCTNHRCTLCDIDMVLILLEEADDADVEEVKHGEWEIKTDEYDCEYMMCSVCKEEFYPADADTVDITPNYCPNCGAKMDVERKGE